MSEPVHQSPSPNPGSGEMFDHIAGRYDLLNRVMSMGIDQSWRRKTVAAMELPADARVQLQAGDAQALPYEDDSFDGCCIAFGIRNVPDRSAALAEMARVTKPGGRIAVLELGEPSVGWLSPIARFHVRKVIPKIGGMLSGSREYKYLQESIAAFPSADDFAKQMQACGLNVLEVKPLTFGACTLFVAEPLEAAS